MPERADADYLAFGAKPPNYTWAQYVAAMAARYAENIRTNPDARTVPAEWRQAAYWRKQLRPALAPHLAPGELDS